MKKVILFIVFSIILSQETPIMVGQELIDISHFVEENNMTVDTWSITMKEKIHSKAVLKNTVQQLSKQYDQAVSKDDHAHIYFYEGTHNEAQIDVSFKVVQSISEESGEIVAVISGQEWNGNILQNYLTMLQTINENYFTEKSHVYTCLTIENGVIISSDNFLEKMIKNFNLSNVTTQIDKVSKKVHKKVIYGYTPIWDKKLMIKDEPMNLQVVIDGDDSEERKVIIGTPVLINEY